jgi:hypothetical protein
MSEPHPSPRTEELVRALMDEQHDSWQRGDTTPVEAYLDRHPTLREPAEAVLDLIC